MTVEVRTDDPGGRFAVGAAVRAAPTAAPAASAATAGRPPAGELTVVSARWHAGRLLVAFEEIAGRDAAEALRGSWLTVDAAAIPPPADPDEFHDQQLVGLRVVTVAGEQVGTVSDVLHHGQDLLVVAPPDAAAEEMLVPFVRAIAVEVDLTGGRIVIDPPGGLLDLPAGERGGGRRRPGGDGARTGTSAAAGRPGRRSAEDHPSAEDQR